MSARLVNRGLDALTWLVLVLALGIPLTMGAIWAMKPKRNPWNRKTLEPVPKAPVIETDTAKSGGAGKEGQAR